VTSVCKIHIQVFQTFVALTMKILLWYFVALFWRIALKPEQRFCLSGVSACFSNVKGHKYITFWWKIDITYQFCNCSTTSYTIGTSSCWQSLVKLWDFGKVQSKSSKSHFSAWPFPMSSFIRAQMLGCDLFLALQTYKTSVLDLKNKAK